MTDHEVTLHVCAVPGQFVVDGLYWASPTAICASSLCINDEAEEPDGYLLAAVWEHWEETAEAKPSGLKIKHTSFIELMVSGASRSTGGVPRG
jgi:hypothetical protein